MNCQHSSNIFVFPHSTCLHGDPFELCYVYFLLIAVVFQLVKSHIECDFYLIAFAPNFAASGGTDTGCSQPGGGKDNVSKHLHPTALHWGQHWPTGGTTPDIEQASVQ